MGIYALYNTPTWADDLNKICTELDPVVDEYCNYLKNDCANCQTVGVQDSWYWQFNYDLNRFQEYAEDYLVEGGQKEMPLLDLSSI